MPFVYYQASIGDDSLSGCFSFRSAVSGDGCIEESIQSLGELYYLKTENRAGLSKNNCLCEEGNPGRRDAAIVG